MRRYQLGILIGLVLSALLGGALALTLSKERRRQVSQHFEEIRKAFPDGEHLKHSAQEVVIKARETGNHLGDQMQASISKLGQRTQEMVGAAQQTATSWGANLHAKSSDLMNGQKERG